MDAPYHARNDLVVLTMLDISQRSMAGRIQNVKRPDCRHFPTITFSKGLERSNTNKSAMQFHPSLRGKSRKSFLTYWPEMSSTVREVSQAVSQTFARASTMSQVFSFRTPTRRQFASPVSAERVDGVWRICGIEAGIRHRYMAKSSS